jgi:hypothetical protein
MQQKLADGTIHVTLLLAESPELATIQSQD